MIPEKLHLVGAGRSTRPATLKLTFAAAAISLLAASGAHAQFDNGGYTSSSTPEARAQQTNEQTNRDKQSGIAGPNALSGPIPELQLYAAVSLAETYSSNASGSFGINDGYDLYTTPGIHLGLLEQSAHLTASLNYSLTGQYHARRHNLDQFTNNLDAMANAELLDRTLFLDAQAFARPQALTRAGSLTANDGTPINGNYRDSYGYSVRPTLIHQFGNIAETDLWFSQSGVFFVEPGGKAPTTPLPSFFQPPTNSNTSQIGARISSLDNFVRLKWSLNGTASNTYQSGHNYQKARSGYANVSYVIFDGFSIIGTGGYQTYHTSYLLTKDLDGPTLLGGFQFAPDPNFSVYVQAGTQSNFPTYIGELNWNITPLTRFSANASDKVQTPQQQLLGDLQNPVGNPGAGGTPGSPGGVPTGSTPGSGGYLGNGLSINNALYRYRQFKADLMHSTDRMQYDLQIYATLRDQLNSDAFSLLDKHEKSYGMRASVSRHLRRDLIGTAAFTASRANEFRGTDRILEGDLGLTYQASPTLSFYVNNSVLNRSSGNLVGFPNGNLTDVRVTVGVRKSF